MRRNPLLFLVTAGVFAFLLGPLVIVAGTAFSDTPYLAFPPKGLSLRWFVNAFVADGFAHAFLISLELATLGTSIALLIGIPAAYALSRYRVQLPRVIGNLFILPILVPEIVLGFSMLNSFTAGRNLPVFPILLVGHTIMVLPYVVRVVAASLRNLDFGVEEAAISLGSPPLKTFFTIVLPNVQSGVLAAFILAFITSLNDVSISVFLTGPGVSPLPIFMIAYIETQFDPTIAAVSVLLMVLTVGVMAVVERTLGLTQVVR